MYVWVIDPNVVKEIFQAIGDYLSPEATYMLILVADTLLEEESSK